MRFWHLANAPTISASPSFLPSPICSHTCLNQKGSPKVLHVQLMDHQHGFCSVQSIADAPFELEANGRSWLLRGKRSHIFCLVPGRCPLSALHCQGFP
jgi:hypothetical protein